MPDVVPMPKSASKVFLLQKLYQRETEPVEPSSTQELGEMTGRAAHIDGIRAVAVMLVLAFHGFPWLVPGGYVGVDVFFVISGYLITGTILKDLRENNFSFERFYSRRVRRIFPALIVVLAAGLVWGWLELLPADYELLGRQVVAAALFIPNILFWNEAGYFDKSAHLKPLLHLWSLGVEEQFYIFWPLLLLCLAKWRPKLPTVLLIITATSFAYGCHLISADPVAAFYSPFPRIWELSIGALLAAWSSKLRYDFLSETVKITLGIAAVGALGAAAFLFRPDSQFPGALAALPTLGTAMLIWAGPHCLINKHVFSLRPIAYIGLFSYPLYLWHWPLLSFANILQKSNAEVTLALLAVSVVLAILTYEYIEKPCQKRPLKILTGGLLTSMAIAAFAGMFVYFDSGVFARYPRDVAQILSTMKYDYGSDARLYICWLEDGRGPQEFAPECLGSQEPPSALIWGDSYAARFYPGLQTIFANSDVAEQARSSCPPLQLPAGLPTWRSGSVTENCRLSNERVFNDVAKIAPKKLILFAYWSYYADNWSDDSPQGRALSDQLNRLASLNLKDVVVIGPAPLWRPNLPLMMYKAWSTNGAVPLYDSTHVTREIDVDRQLRWSVEKAGARYISLIELLCNDTGCLTHVPGSPGLLLSFDGGHLTTSGAEFVVQSLRSRGLL